VRVSRN